jgi:hypothetical protein
VLKCDNFVLDDLGNGEYYELTVNKPCSRARISNYNIKRLYVYAATATPNNCTKEYIIDVFITKVNTIEGMFVTPIASQQ